jgi:Arc/MetJ-type ribon-helix-helix transcriptional regulator
MKQVQLNVRISEQLEKVIDEKRVALLETIGSIPTRSDVLRMALEAYLGITLSETEADGRLKTGPRKRKAAKSRSK